MKILVVDDTRIILSVIEAILTQENQDVVSASDGREGLQAFYDHAPEMVITDIEMPWQDGLSMMKSIRRTHPEVFTLYMTGNPGPYHQQLTKEADTFGAGLLNKPFTRSELLRSMTEILSQASPGQHSRLSLKPQAAVDLSDFHPAKHDLESLSVANFQREYRYEKIHRPVADRHYVGGIRAGSRG
jgi:DNA-binding response OmpR family regulator